jgi:hypothetical protein
VERYLLSVPSTDYSTRTSNAVDVTRAHESEDT